MKKTCILLTMILSLIFVAGCKKSDDATTNEVNISGNWEMTVTVLGATFTGNVTINGNDSEGTIKSDGFSTGEYMIIDDNKIVWDWENDMAYEGYNGIIHSSTSMSGQATIMQLETKEVAEATWSAKKL